MNLRQLLTYKFFIPWVLVIVLMGVIAASIGARAIDLSFRRELSAALEGFTLSCSDPKMESIQKGQFGTLLVIGAGEIADTEIQALLPSPLIEHLKAPSGERNEIRSWSTASGIYALKSIDRGGGESAWAIAFAQRPQFDRYLRPLIGLTLMFLMTVGMVGYWLLRRTDRLLAGAADSLRALALAISSGGISGHVSEETAPLRPVGHRGVAEFDEIANGLY
ncbi:MAG: hypothetical protein KDK40_01935, partial [Chlamydiia bacterium]|nr:hypothetical protein [Chlamydiia bacterium]